MSQKSKGLKDGAEATVRDIRRRTLVEGLGPVGLPDEVAPMDTRGQDGPIREPEGEPT